MMALLAAMVARRVSCSTLPLWRPLSLGPLTHSPFAGASSRALHVSAHSLRRMLAFNPLTLASSSGARLQPQSIVSRSSTQALRFFLQGTPTFGSPFSSSVVHDRLMLFCLLCRRSCSLIPWFFGTPLIFLPTVVVLLWTSFFLRLLSQPASLSTRVRIAVPLRLFVAPCSLFRPHVVPLSFSFFSLFALAPCARLVHCGCCLSSQSLCLAPVRLGPFPGFPERASVLDSPFDSFTRILCGCASHHSRRCPGTAHAQGSLFGGMMHVTTLWLLATAHNVTFAALGLLRIRLVSASCVSSSTAQSVPPGHTSGTSGWVL